MLFKTLNITILFQTLEMKNVNLRAGDKLKVKGEILHDAEKYVNNRLIFYCKPLKAFQRIMCYLSYKVSADAQMKS